MDQNILTECERIEPGGFEALMNTPNDNIIEFVNITKRFPGVTALNHVNFGIKQGEVHILVGQNGAGKSSLIKLLTGIYHPDEGEIIYQGKPYAPKNTSDAFHAGIRVVHQEFNLLPYLSVAENIYFERLPANNGFVNFKKLYQDTEKILKRVGLDITPQTRVENLGIAQMQLVEIAKALIYENKVLIMDEPTATLTSSEISTLFKIIHELKKQGVTIIYISHRLQEIYEIGDRVTVLRNGEYVITRNLAELTINDLVRYMVGKEIDNAYPFDNTVSIGSKFFEVKNLKYKGNHHEVSFQLHHGEIIGIAGLVGSGRTETVRAIFGADKRENGQFFIDGKEIIVNNPRDAVESGLSLLTEDRKSQGIILNMNIALNTTLAHLAKVSNRGWLNFKKESDETDKLIKEIGISTTTNDKLVRNLSGGNQQKVVLAKWLFRDANVLIFDEPTRGIDVGARYEIYMLLWKLAAQGKGIIVVSSDMDELIGICHRILVFSDGKMTADIPRLQFDQELILRHAYEEYIH